MSDSTDQSVEELALDYVLGFADADERHRIEAAMAHETVLADAIHEWQTRLSPLGNTVPPATPPASVWQSLERRTHGGLIQRIVSRPAWAGAGALAIAASILLVLLWPRHPVSQLALRSPDGTVLATAEIDRGNIMHLHPVAMPPAPAGKSYELWIIPAGSSTPEAEGTMPDDPTTPIHLVRVEAGATLAVSVEPAGGSPSGHPTGPVVATGSITAI